MTSAFGLAEAQEELERQRSGLAARIAELDRQIEAYGEERDRKARELRDCKTAIAAMRRLRGLPPRAPRGETPPVALVR